MDGQNRLLLNYDEFIPVGPVNVTVNLTDDTHGPNVKLLVSGQQISGNVENKKVRFTINSITDHEVAVIS